jgi:hypothetical protein
MGGIQKKTEKVQRGRLENRRGLRYKYAGYGNK